jgi:hypothetical protein
MTRAGAETSTITLASVHQFALTATARTLRQALRDMNGCSMPADLTLRALTCSFDCDTQGAIALLRRALKHRKATDDDRWYINDLLCATLMSIGDYAGLENAVAAERAAPPRLIPAQQAKESMLHAVGGRRSQSRFLARKAAASARSGDAPLILAQVLLRCSLAAFYRSDFYDAMELSLESAHLYEAHGAFVGATSCHSIAGVVAQDWKRDSQMAAEFYARMVMNAERAGHQAILRSALAGSFSAAAERFDAPACESLHERLRSYSAPQQHQENYPYLLGEILGFGWTADFGAAETAIVAGTATAKSQQEAAMLESLR